MAVFLSRSRDAGGSVVEKRIDAASKRDAVRILEEAGLAPIEVKAVLDAVEAQSKPAEPALRKQRVAPARASEAEGDRLGPKDRPIRRKVLRRFTIQLGSAFRAGVPIHSALASIASQTDDPKFRAVVEHLARRVERGGGLSEGMHELPRAFPRLYVGSIQAGERSGTLDTMLDDLAEYLEADMEMRADVRSAVMYPLFVMSTLFAAMSILVFFVVPRFAEFYSGFQAELPLPTRILIGISEFAKSYGPWLGGAFALLVMAAPRLLRRPEVRLRTDRWLRHVPFLGGLLETAATLQVTRMLHLVIGAGLPLLEGLETIASAASDTKVRDDLRAVSRHVESGATLAEGLDEVGCLPRDARQMIMTGEQTGSLQRSCAVVAEQYKKDLRYLTKNASTFIEPVLTLFLAGVVLFVALAAFLPMWELVRVVQH